MMTDKILTGYGTNYAAIDIGSNAVRLLIKHVEETGGTFDQSGLTLSHGANYVSSSLTGVYPNEIEINKKEMMCGRFINDIDIEQKRKVLVLGEDDAKELMPRGTERLIGQYVNVASIAFRVVGIY